MFKKIIIEKYTRLIQIMKYSPDIHTKVACLIENKLGNCLIESCNELPKNITIEDYKLQRPEKYNWFICAERNAIYKSAKNGISLNNCVMYVSRPPCIECAKAIIQSGIKKIILIGEIYNIIEKYKDIYNITAKLFNEASIKLEIYDINDKDLK